MTVKLASFMVVAVMLMTGLVAIIPSSSARPVDEAPSGVVYDPSAMTISQDKINELAAGTVMLDASATTASATAVAGDDIGTNKTYIALNTYTGGYYLMTIQKRAEGEHCEVWVAAKLFYPSGDPRNDNTSRFNITDDQVNYMIDEFDNNIYVNESDFFGVPNERNGTEAQLENYFGPGYDYFNTTDGSKTMIIVMNIRDEGYYDYSYPYYVVGFFSSTSGDIYDRNIIHIDCYDWADRTGDQGASNPKSYLYESTVAHEYQHLLHNCFDPQEESFVNEGCSDYAELVCGYGMLSLSSHIGNFLNEPTNSLTVWGDGDQLADYGAAALFTIFLNDKFGGAETIQTLVHDNLTGIEGIMDTLAKRGYTGITFDDVFKQWRIANLLDSNQPGNGKYKYETLNLADIGAMYTWTMTKNAGWYSDYVGSYGTDYVNLERNAMKTRERLRSYIEIAADNKDRNAGWIDEGSYWWSNNFDQCDYALRGTIDLTDTMDSTHTLSIYTWYDIEEGWDFGMVQVSTDGGMTWTSLANAATTDVYDPSAMESITDQLPGITGYSGGWTWLSYDLSAYDEQVIEVQFRYMTDWATTYDGWYIQQINLDGSFLDSASYEYYFAPVLTDAYWMVSMVMYHNDKVIGIIDVPLYGSDIWYGGYDTFWYKPFKLRAVTSVTMLVSPSCLISSDYYIEAYTYSYI